MIDIIEESVKTVTPIPWYALLIAALFIFFVLMLIGTDGFSEDIGFVAIVSGIPVVILVLIICATNVTKPRKQFYAKVGSISYEEMSEYKVIDRIGNLDDEYALYILEEPPK